MTLMETPSRCCHRLRRDVSMTPVRGQHRLGGRNRKPRGPVGCRHQTPPGASDGCSAPESACLRGAGQPYLTHPCRLRVPRMGIRGGWKKSFGHKIRGGLENPARLNQNKRGLENLAYWGGEPHRTETKRGTTRGTSARGGPLLRAVPLRHTLRTQK